MEYLYIALYLIGGFVLLIKGADFFVDGSSKIAKFFKIPSIIIGLTIVAIGTSLPEASVSINASLSGSNSIAVSNVIGSNIFNTLVVLGASALLCPVAVQASAIKKEIPFSILLSAVLAAMLFFGNYTLGRISGAILLVLLALYMFWQIRSALKAKEAEAENESTEKIKIWLTPILIVVGVAGIILGGNFVVEGATRAAKLFGMSDTLIGLTIVAIGTSLPELVTSVVAAVKGESDLALGNAIGSSIFNIVFILGMSAVISPMTVDVLSLYDTLILIAISAVCLLFAATKKKIARWEGAVMVGIYAAYMAYIIIR